jgi:hypothetical protein
MVDANIYHILLPTYIIDIYNAFEVLVCCLKGVWVHPYILIPAKLEPNFVIFGHLWSGNDAITS